MIQFDPGSQGNQGPFLSWHARGTDDGEIPAKSFSLRDENGRSAFSGFKKGIAMDLDTLRTGWSHTAGVSGIAPEWAWNDSIEAFEPKPADGREWKRGFEMTVAINKDQTAIWQQASAGSFQAFTDLMSDIIDQQGEYPALTPIVVITGTEPIQFTKGSTAKPKLEIKKWVDKPDILSKGSGSSDDSPGAPEAPPVEDDIEEF